MLTAEQIKKLHDKGYTHGQTTRQKASDDMLFALVSQWDDNFLSGSTLQYRGQFDMLRKAYRQIISAIKANPVQVDFEPVDGTDESGAEIIDGMYRSDMRNNSALEAKDNAMTEAVICGYGGWELISEYKTDRVGDNKQVIRRRPLYEMNNNVFWSPNAKAIDKSDAEWVSCLIAYSEDGYRNLVKELTGREEVGMSSFAQPEQSYVFPWVVEDATYYVSRFYHREKTTVKYLIFRDLMGSERVVKEEDFEEQEEFLANNEFELADEYEKEIYQVRLYIVGGGEDEILDSYIIPGEHIPVIPVYGERAFVEGEEHYEGITRLSKDIQRLINFMMSYLADVVSQTPRAQPIYLAEQVQGFESMYEKNGSDNIYPYLLQNRFDAEGNELPLGPVGMSPEQPVPQSLLACMELARVAMNDVASADLPQDITDTDLSGKALQQLQKRFDMQSYTYQHNGKFADRREGEVYASMARDVYDSEREMNLVKPDNSVKKEVINQEDIDPESLQLVVKNDIKSFIFDVYADIGPSYQNVKEETREKLFEMIQVEPPDSPMRQLMILEYWTMQDGDSFKDLRDYARKELILQGVKDPETPEEQQMVEQAQAAAQEQQNQPDPAMLMAQAEMGRAQAEQMNAEANVMDKHVDMMNAETNKFNAQTKRGEAEIKAMQAGADVNYKRMQTHGVAIDNRQKVTGQQLRNSINQ
jgi:hypothetical protein